MKLQGKIVLVTGGGQGIGRGIVERFLDEGALVAIAQRNIASIQDLPADRVLLVKADLSNTVSIASVVTEVVEHFGGLDVLVNNAGIMFERSVDEISLDEWNQMMSVNLTAPLFLVQAALPHLKNSGEASIINIGSIEGLAANPEHAAYCASKAAIHGLTNALAVDLGAFGIRCNAIAPGWITSALSENYIQAQQNPAQAQQELIRMHPVGRVGKPHDIGDLAVFLASSASAFITGQIIVADGGRTSKLPLPF